MNNDMIRKYKEEFTRLYAKNAVSENKARPAVAMQETTPDGDTGKLIAFVTTLRGLYPVSGAKATVFTGPYENMRIEDTDLTNENGTTKAFNLYAPPRDLSQAPDPKTPPYKTYNLLITADGYVDNIHTNIPIFRGVTSVQKTDLVLRSAVGNDAGPFVFNESGGYNL